jgi:hypothetical protein
MGYVGFAGARLPKQSLGMFCLELTKLRMARVSLMVVAVLMGDWKLASMSICH